MKKPKFYFANQTSMALQGLEVQRYIEARVLIELDNPFFDKAGVPTQEMKNILYGESNPVNQYEVTGRDINKVCEDDGIVAYFSCNELCIGTAWEMAVCRHAWGKPVYIIDEVPDKDIKKHPFPPYYGIPVFPSKEKFVDFAIAKWGQVEPKRKTNRRLKFFLLGGKK